MRSTCRGLRVDGGDEFAYMIPFEQVFGVFLLMLALCNSECDIEIST